MLGNIGNTVVAVATAGLVVGLAALQPVTSAQPPRPEADGIKAAARDAAVVAVKTIEVLGPRELPIIVERAEESSVEVRVAARFEPPEAARHVEFLTISASPRRARCARLVIQSGG